MEGDSKTDNADEITYLKLWESPQQYFKSLQVVLIRKDLDDAVHQVALCNLIFTIDNLSK